MISVARIFFASVSYTHLDVYKRQTVPDAAQWNAFTGIMSAISTLARGDGLLGALEEAGINGARLSLVDPDGRQKAGLEDVEIRLTRIAERGTRMTMKGRTGQRWKELALSLIHISWSRARFTSNQKRNLTTREQTSGWTATPSKR